MASHLKLLAFDLGAESGRGVLGLFDGRELRLEVVHRFPNGAVRTRDTLHWDVLRLHGEMLQTLRITAADFGGVDCLGVDTWGVDFALLGRDGSPNCCTRPYAHRRVVASSSWLVLASVNSLTLTPVKKKWNRSGMNSSVSAASRSGERSRCSASSWKSVLKRMNWRPVWR